MNEFNNPPRSSLIGMLSRSLLEEEDITYLHRKAWTDQGLLIVRPSDSRLTPAEAAFIRDIAERLYEEVS